MGKELGKEITNLKNKNNDDDDLDDQILWNSVAKNYEMIQGAHCK
jgi:hypothetical protein